MFVEVNGDNIEPDAELSDAELSDAELSDAELSGATMPDGSIHE